MLPKISRSLPVLSITKGLYANENGKFIPFPNYLASFESCEGLSLNADGGSCISFELADRHHTVVAFCGHDMETLKKLKSFLSTDYYHISLTNDVIGLEMAVSMKNAYALGVSLAIGQAESKNGEGGPEEYNPEAGLFAQSIRETVRLLKNCGGGADMIFYSAGDLYVTVFGGRTRRIGTLLGKELTYNEAREILSGETLESVAITKLVIEALERQGDHLDDFPLLGMVLKLQCFKLQPPSNAGLHK